MPTGPGEVDQLLRGAGEGWHRHPLESSNIATLMVLGEPRDGMLLRIQYECQCRALYGVAACDCNRQLRDAMDRIEAEGTGAIITSRYGVGNEVYQSALERMAVREVRLLTNNPQKTGSLGDAEVTRVPHLVPIHPDTLARMQARTANGYLIRPDMIRLSADPNGPGTPLVPPPGIECKEAPVAAHGVDWREVLLVSPAATDEPVAFVLGDVTDGAPVFIKSSCRECDALGNVTDCGCTVRANAAIAAIVEAGAGVYIHLRQDGRGVGQGPKLEAMERARNGEDSIATYRALGLPDDARVYPDVTMLLTKLDLKRITLLDAPVMKYGDALHGFEVREVSLDYKIPVDAYSYYNALVKRGLALPGKRISDDAPIVERPGLGTLTALRGQYLGDLALVAQVGAQERETIATRTAAQFERAVGRITTLYEAFRDSAPVLSELHGTGWSSDRGVILAEAGASAIQNVYGALDEASLAIRIESESLRAAMQAQAEKDETELKTALQEITMRELLRDEGVNPEAVVEIRELSERISARSVTSHGYRLRYFETQQLPDALAEPIQTVRAAFRLLGQAYRRATDVDVPRGDHPDSLGVMADPEVFGCSLRSTPVHQPWNYLWDPEKPEEPWKPMDGGELKEPTEWSSAFTSPPNALRLFPPLDRVPEPPELTSALDHDQILGQWFYREPRLSVDVFDDGTYELRLNPTTPDSAETPADLNEQLEQAMVTCMTDLLAATMKPSGDGRPRELVSSGAPRDIFAPPPIAHDFHQLGSKWRYFAQRSIVGDPPARVFTYGELGPESLIRVHSACVLGDACGSDHCECGQQLQEAMEQIKAHGSGAIIYLDQDGRGAGALAKAYAYRDKQLDNIETFESYRNHGFEEDPRLYDDVPLVLEQLGLAEVPIRMLTNNPGKLNFLLDRGFDVTHQPLEMPATTTSLSYLQTKVEYGHMMRHLGKVHDPVAAREVSRRGENRPRTLGREWWRSHASTGPVGRGRTASSPGRPGQSTAHSTAAKTSRHR